MKYRVNSVDSNPPPSTIDCRRNEDWNQMKRSEAAIMQQRITLKQTKICRIYRETSFSYSFFFFLLVHIQRFTPHSISFCQPILHLMKQIAKRSIATLVHHDTIHNDVQPFGPCIVAIHDIVLKGIYHKLTREIFDLLEFPCGCNAVINISMSGDDGISCENIGGIGEEPFIHSVCLVDINGQHACDSRTTRAIMIINLCHSVYVASKWGSGVATHVQYQWHSLWHLLNVISQEGQFLALQRNQFGFWSTLADFGRVLRKQL